MRIQKSLLSVLAAGVISCTALAQGPPVEYIGTDLNWLNPANWSSGELPDASTDVLITGGASVQIDPALAAGPIAVRDITVEDGSTLTLLPGTEMSYNAMLVDDANVDAQSSEFGGDSLELLGSGAKGPIGMRLNPTTNDTRSIKITANTAGIFALGGTAPASPGNTGAGFYATLVADEVELGGTLEVETIYGFTPGHGQTFQIITVNDTLTGTFEGLPEGAVIQNLGALDLKISYLGGDGNDVVITAAYAAGSPGVPVLTGAGLLLLVGVFLLLGIGAQRFRRA